MIADADQPAALLGELDRLRGSVCASCARPLCGHLLLCSMVLGLKDAPRCLSCLAHALERSAGALGCQLVEYVQQRDCYRQAWDVASDREGIKRSPQPVCLGAAEEASPPVWPEAFGGRETAPAAVWDAGDMGCGELVLALRLRLQALAPGAVLQVIARDPAAPLDLPAWCRLTGNSLRYAAHPEYHITRKES